MYRLQRLRPVRLGRLAAQQSTSSAPARTFTTSYCLRRDDFDTEEPANSPPRRSGAEKRARQGDAMSILDNPDDQTSPNFLDEPSDLPAQPARSQGRGKAPALDVDDAGQFQTRGQGRTSPPVRREQREEEQEEDDKEEEEDDDETGVSTQSSDRRLQLQHQDPRKSQSMNDLDEYDEQFSSEPEQRIYEEMYGEVQELLVKTQQIRKVQKKKEVKDSPQGDVAKQCEVQLREVDEGIKTALQGMMEKRNRAYVPFQPEGVNMKTQYRSQTGAAGVGEGGVGNVMEDSLRYLGNREGHRWQHPRDLASRLAQGEFVKFKSHTERRQVLGALQNVAREPGKNEWKKVKFQPLAPEARRSLAQRAMFGQGAGSGRPQEPVLVAGQMRGPQDVLDSARRVAGGQIKGSQMETFLQTIGELLPQDRGQSQQARK